MADQMVLKTQQWLNNTYGNDSRYNSVTEDGITGWETINGLTRALQIEFGITATADNFGPTTEAKFLERFPNGIQQQAVDDETESNIYAIIQGACWCKGYSTNASDITKHFYSGTGNAIKSLKNDAGCSDTTSTVTLNVMKALLSMNQYKLVSGGTNSIRGVQRNLNREYEDYIGLSPCDGLYGREMNEALIKVLQAIEGYSVDEATGNFGSGTKANLPIVPSNGELSSEVEEKAIKLVRYALCCNGFDVGTSSGQWDSRLETRIQEFQATMCLTQTMICDTNTWMALLLSKGNPDRSCIACDTRFEMTESRLKYLKDNGYQIVGRYLTGGDFKELRTWEINNILNEGIKVFPIFQESGANLSYFTSERGKIDAKNSVIAARKHGIPGNTIIYFAVDTDPTDSQISTYILPYFKSLSENISKYYRVGVYGTRNVCTQVMNKGYAETCFVSNMSTGYSGNMGFKMPENWNLDQFHEIKNISVGNTTMDLDKVAYSGKYPVVEDVYLYITRFNEYIKELEDLYVGYKGTCTVRELTLGVINFLRSFKYRNIEWYAATLTDIDDDFIDYVKTNDIQLYNFLVEYASTDSKALADGIGGYIDIGHLAVSIEGYMGASLAPDFWLGWGGDLASLMSSVDSEYEVQNKTHLEIAKSLLGERSKFNYMDICTDADAIKIAEILQNINSEHPFSDAISQYYLNYSELRLSYYLTDIGTNSLELANLKEAIKNKMTGLFENTILLPIIGTLPTNNSKEACCEAFAQYIIDNYPTI